MPYVFKYMIVSLNVTAFTRTKVCMRIHAYACVYIKAKRMLFVTYIICDTCVIF